MPFNRKHAAAPSAVNASPATTGPMMRARLNWIEFSAIAFEMSFFSTKVGIKRLVSRSAKGLGGASQKGKQQNVPDAHSVEVDQSRQCQSEGHLQILRTEQQSPPVHPVGHDAADQREQQDRHLAQKRVESQQECRPCQSENKPALGNFLHPGPHRGNKSTAPQHSKLRISEGLERSAEKCRLQQNRIFTSRS